MATCKHSSGEKDHLFHSVDIAQHVVLPPTYMGRFAKGITEVLNTKLLTFLPEYQGFVLAYSKPVVLQHAARIVNESPNLHFDVQVKLYLFTPVVGACLCATVDHTGVDHLGCSVWDCFNASVRRTRLSSITKGDSIRFRVLSVHNMPDFVCIYGEEV